MLLSNECKEKTKLVYKDNEGRFIHVAYETDNQIFNIVSVYAPNNYLEKSKYFKIIKQYILLHILFHEKTLLHSFLALHISYILQLLIISFNDLYPSSELCFDLLPLSKFERVVLKSPPVVEKGPGLWVLNNTVLSNEIYVRRVKEIIADSVNCEMYDNEPLIWWDKVHMNSKTL
jgi:hypothetical protein